MFRLLSIVTLLILSGCWNDPRLQANTEADFNASYASATSSMSPEEKTQFDTALKDIVFIQTGAYAGTLDAGIYFPRAKGPGADIANSQIIDLGNSFTKLFQDFVSVITPEAWDKNRGKMVVEHARAIVDGRTAKEIVTIAAHERAGEINKILNSDRSQLAESRKELADLQAESAKMIAGRDASADKFRNDRKVALERGIQSLEQKIGDLEQKLKVN